jgi:membrane fusion protein, adhesin transport system
MVTASTIETHVSPFPAHHATGVQERFPIRSIPDRALPSTRAPLAQLAGSTRWVRRIAVWLFIILLAGMVAMLLLPWQQTVTGRGRVITYDPNHRQQEVDAPISGRLVEIRPGLVEGARVRAGEVLMKIEVVDPILKQRIDEQIEAQRQKLASEKVIVSAYRKNVEAFEEVYRQTSIAQDEFVKVGEQKVLAAEQGLEAAIAKYDQKEKDRIRREELFKQKVESRYEWELAVADAAEAKAKLGQARTYVAAEKNELSAKMAERLHKLQEAQAKIDSARAVYSKSVGDVASAEKELSDVLAKGSLQVQPVTAPLDGYVLKLRSFQGGQIVSVGSPLFELVPATADRAVEIKVDGNDAPLVATHDQLGAARKVRLQFEGWPAVQFAGWPSVAIGTFGGVVAIVDQADDGNGKFRVLIRPDPEDRPWPEASILRQGVRVNGWVLLDEVTLGQEMWRQFNGFPPTVAIAEAKKDEALLRGKK